MSSKKSEGEASDATTDEVALLEGQEAADSAEDLEARAEAPNEDLTREDPTIEGDLTAQEKTEGPTAHHRAQSAHHHHDTQEARLEEIGDN